MVISKINNLHIHNSNSKCCWNRYPIKVLHDYAIAAKLQYCGSTNHIYAPLSTRDNGQPEDIFQRHILWTKEEIASLDSQIPIYLGAEVDISNDSGKSFFLPHLQSHVDYWIAGMHSYYNEPILKSMYVKKDRDDFLKDYFEEWGNWAEKFIRKSRPDIFVHIFWQELEIGLFDEKSMMPTAERIFEAAAESGTAIECSSLQMRKRRPQMPFWEKFDPRGDHTTYFFQFYKKLFIKAKDAKCMVSFGSDAHIPEEIGDVIQIKQFLENIGFEDQDIYEPKKK